MTFRLLFKVDVYICTDIQLVHTQCVFHLELRNDDPLDQIGACFPPGSEDLRLMFRVIIFSKFKTMIGAP